MQRACGVIDAFLESAYWLIKLESGPPGTNTVNHKRQRHL
jgi:hypothetical protein